MYMYIYIIHVHVCSSVPGGGIGKGDTYQRVYVDDGSTTVGPLDYLVHQTAPLSLSHHFGCHTTPQGIYIYILYVHVHVHMDCHILLPIIL